MSTRGERLFSPMYFWGCLRGFTIVVAVYVMTYVGMYATGTMELVPGAHHTVCMVIFGLGYVVSSGKVRLLVADMTHDLS